MKSRDRGESWEDLTADLLRFTAEQKYKSRIVSQTDIEGMLDGHALACSAAAPGTVFLANRMGLFRSDDGGTHRADVEVGRFSPLTYGRDLRVSPHDPEVLYAALRSPAFRSYEGGIFRSVDVGRTWRRLDHGVKAEATMMGVTVHPRDPRQVCGISKAGQVFSTRDNGESWAESRLPERGRRRLLRDRLRLSDKRRRGTGERGADNTEVQSSRCANARMRVVACIRSWRSPFTCEAEDTA